MFYNYYPGTFKAIVVDSSGNKYTKDTGVTFDDITLISTNTDTSFVIYINDNGTSEVHILTFTFSTLTFSFVSKGQLNAANYLESTYPPLHYGCTIC